MKDKIAFSFAVASLAAVASVEFVSCPKCDMRMRVNADASKAFVNVARLQDDEPDAATLDGRKAAMKARAEKMLAIAADAKRLAVPTRPLMGWSSWNAFGLGISDRLIMDVAEAMSTNGLKAAGYAYVNIDDGFFDGHDASGRLRINAKRFPGGMKPVVDRIHALGLKAGTYSDGGSNTCGSIWGKDTSGIGAGLYGHDAADLDMHFREFGFDFIKVDFCGGREQKLDERARYTEISRALAATGRADARMNICRWAFPGTWAADVAGSWRTTGDIRASWSFVKRIVEENLNLSAYASTGHYNDLDMLEAGHVKGKTRTAFGKADEGLTRDEEQAHFGMWCIMSSPLLLGCDVRALDRETFELVTNPFLLAMNQNDLGLQAYPVKREGAAYTLVKDADRLHGPARYVAFFNAGEKTHRFRLDFLSIGLAGRIEAFDLAERADPGTCEGILEVDVAPHAAKFYRFDAERRLDRVVYEAECAWLAGYTELNRKSGGADKLSDAEATPHYRPLEGASGGFVAASVGGDPSNVLVWKDVYVSKCGAVRLDLDVFPDADSEFFISVDDGAPVKIAVPAAQGKKSTVSQTFDLAAGSHRVTLSHPSKRLPPVDVLRVVR